MNSGETSKFLNKNKNVSKKKKLILFVNKLLVLMLLFMAFLITIKIKPEWKMTLKEQLFEKTISFTQINNWYQSHFGNVLPFDNILPNDEIPVFDEKLAYTNINAYKDGAELEVTTNYLVPVLESGIIVYIGKKDNYNSTVVVQQVNGIDVWYGNVNIGDYKIYDYVVKGSLLGETINDTLYLVFQKDGKYLAYQDYV